MDDPIEKSWKKFDEQRKQDLKNPQFMYLHRKCYEKMARFQFLQHQWGFESIAPNPFNVEDEIEYSIQVNNFGPDVRQVSQVYSPSYYLNKVNQSTAQQTAMSKASNPRPSYFIKGSHFGIASFKKYKDIFNPNSQKKSDSKFSSPFAYFAETRLKVIEKEKPSIRKSMILPEIVNEWKNMEEDKKSQIRNAWKNYISIYRQLNQFDKYIKADSENNSDNSSSNNNLDNFSSNNNNSDNSSSNNNNSDNSSSNINNSDNDSSNNKNEKEILNSENNITNLEDIKDRGSLGVLLIQNQNELDALINGI